MSNILLSSLAYIGSRDLYAYYHVHDTIMIDLHQNYIKGSERNRAFIATAQGAQLLSIPLLKGKNQKQALKDVKISYDQSWQKLHWHAILSAYNNSPFFEYYRHIIEPFYTKKHTFLWEYNLGYLHAIFKILQWKKEIIFTEKYVESTDMKDLRNEELSLNLPIYNQVFSDRVGFQKNVCILDVIFCQGKHSVEYLKTII